LGGAGCTKRRASRPQKQAETPVKKLGEWGPNSLYLKAPRHQKSIKRHCRVNVTMTGITFSSARGESEKHKKQGRRITLFTTNIPYGHKDDLQHQKSNRERRQRIHHITQTKKEELIFGEKGRGGGGGEYAMGEKKKGVCKGKLKAHEKKEY